MNFSNIRFSNMWILALVLIGFILVMNFLPYILIAGVIGYAIRYVYKAVKNRNISHKQKVDIKDNKEFYNKEDSFDSFDKSKVIDVEYTEVK